jgi:hypothetical protein
MRRYGIGDRSQRCPSLGEGFDADQELRPDEKLRSSRKAGRDMILGRPVGTHAKHVGRPAQALHLSASYLQSGRVIVINLHCTVSTKIVDERIIRRPMPPVTRGFTRPALPLEMMSVRRLSAPPSRIIKGHASFGL